MMKIWLAVPCFLASLLESTIGRGDRKSAVAPRLNGLIVVGVLFAQTQTIQPFITPTIRIVHVKSGESLHDF